MPQVPARANAVRKLLIVEDEVSLQLALREYFESLGWRVRCVTGEAATSLLLAHRDFHAVILGLRLGLPADEGALALISLARARARRARIVLFATAGTADLERMAQVRGADVVVYKPQSLAALAQHVMGASGRAQGDARP